VDCYFSQYVLETARTPVFVRNSMYVNSRRCACSCSCYLRVLLMLSLHRYNYGEWLTLPTNWHDNHNCSSGWACLAVPGCSWEGNWGQSGCSIAQLAVIRRYQDEFLKAVAPALDPATKHGAFIDSCPGCHCQGM